MSRSGERSLTSHDRLEPPGPGAWHLDTSHLTTSCSRYHQPLWMDGFPRGFGECLLRYGSLLESLDWAWLNGFPYYRISPVAAPEGATEHPPRDVWDELMTSHPGVQERLANAERAFEQRIWRDDLERWDRVDKPASIKRQRQLLSIDPTSLDTGGLVKYVAECAANVIEGVYLHHVHNMAALIPTGDLIVQGTTLTGRRDSEVLGLLKGSTPDALGTGHLTQALARVASRPDVRKLLESDDAETALATIGALDGEAGAVLREAVSFIAYRPVNGEDVGDTCAFEVPALVLSGISASLESVEHDEGAELEQLTAAIRDDVEPSGRERFDQALEEARYCYRIREERAMYADLWSYGVARRALLGAGERLVTAGRIEEATHLVEADPREVSEILENRGGPDGAELAERARYRAEVGFDEMPEHLGDSPGAPLPIDWLPTASARMEAALGTAIAGLFGPPGGGAGDGAVEGLGVSDGVVEGPARVVDASSDFDRIQDGDVLVTRATTAGFNVVLPLLRGIVTDRGGLLCHAAVVSREYSIPAVVGTGNATSQIADGARIRVDGAAGTVTVLG